MTVWTTQDNRAIIQGEIVSDYVRICECQIVSDYGVRMVYGCGKIWLGSVGWPLLPMIIFKKMFQGGRYKIIREEKKGAVDTNLIIQNIAYNDNFSRST